MSYQAYNAETQKTEISVWVDKGPTGLPVFKVTFEGNTDKAKAMVTMSHAQADSLAEKLDDTLAEFERRVAR